MRTKLIIIFVLCALLFIGYYNLVPEKPGTSSINSSILGSQKPPFSLTTADKLLKINESTSISVIIVNASQSNFSYRWNASIGKIDEGINATNITYTAPEKPGTAIITATIKDSLGKTYTTSMPITVYGQLIIIKADDFLVGSEYTAERYPKWKRFFEYIENKSIKASAGIVGTVLEKRYASGWYRDEFIETYLKNASKSDTFEFWNHGYTHECNSTGTEFFNTSYEHQKEHLLKTQDLAKEKLNLTMHAFGAPCDKTDENTANVLEDVSDIKVWFYGKAFSSDKVLILTGAECGIDKDGTHIPDYKRFVDDYYLFNCSKRDYSILQIHPDEWDDEDFEQFKEITDFLIEQNDTFIKPYEYYELMLDKPGTFSTKIKPHQWFIIKADDFLGNGNMTEYYPKWKRFFEYIENKSIKASVGISGYGLEQNLDASDESKETNKFIDHYLKNASKSDTFEFWNHGYTHEYNSTGTEFFNTSYEHQKEHLLKTQDLAKEKLNLTMHAFGAPFDKTDENTANVLEDVSDIKVWFYRPNSLDSSDKIAVGDVACGTIFEDKSVSKNYSEFFEDYHSLNCDKKDVIVLQTSPNEWDDKSFEQFKKIIDALIEQRAQFINAYEYYQLKTGQK